MTLNLGVKHFPLSKVHPTNKKILVKKIMILWRGAEF